MTILVEDRAAPTQLCWCHQIRRLSLFGSVAAGTARPDSDVDLLLELELGAAPSFLGMAAIEL
jgi:predicted nucleotidyltransferase